MIEKHFIPAIFNTSTLTKGNFTYQTPSNIALVKYWGKEAYQIPKNTSISFTLSACFTRTTLAFTKKQNKNKTFDFKIFFEGKKHDAFKPKIQIFLERILIYLPFLTDYTFIINTRNSFPHSSGIASSASGLSALALCFMEMEKVLNPKMTTAYFTKKASFLARLGSGSASRSIKGEVVVWGKHSKIIGSSNFFGVPFPFDLHKNFKNYHDTILLVDKGEKQVSSTIGHNLMENHPFAEQRFIQANTNINKITKILQNGDLKQFVSIVESEALTLHAMMMSSNPYFILMKPNTLQIIEKIWAFRKETQSNICFTLDAGANVHVLYPEKEKEVCINFIISQLIEHCQNNQYICDRIGFGGKLISKK